MSWKRYVYKLFVALAAFLVSVAAISSPFLPGASPVIQARSPSPAEATHPKALEITSKPQRIFAPHWTTEGEFDTTIYIRNVQYNRAATASPFLQLGNRTIPLPQISLERLETAAIDVRSALQQLGERPDQSGAAYIAFDAPSAGGINAYAQLLNIPKSLSLSLPFMEVAASQTSPLRAVAWRYSNHTDAYIAVQNTSTRAVSVRASIVIEGRETPIREVHLGRGEFDAVKLPSPDGLVSADEARTAGIVLQHDGDAGAVVAQGWLLDDDIGFSAPFGFRGGMAPMSSKDPTERILGAGVMIGNADPGMGFPAGVVFSPQLALWNPSAEGVVARPSFSYTKNSSVQTSTLPPVALGAAASVLINLRDYQLRGLIPPDVAQGNIKLEYNAGHEALLADLASVDQSGSFVSPVPLTCAGNRSMHMVFWRTDGAWESMLTLQNVAATSNDLEVRITWQGGSYLVRETVAPSDSAMVSINMLQSSQQPDEEGHVIPREVALGGVNILSENVDNGLVINAMFMNPVTRTCGGCNQTPYVTNYCLTDKLTNPTTPFYCSFDNHVVGDSFDEYMSVQLSQGAQFWTTIISSTSTNTSIASTSTNIQQCVTAVNALSGGTCSISGTTCTSYFTDPSCASEVQLTRSAALTVQVPTKLVFFDFPPRAPNGKGPVITVTDGDVIDTAGVTIKTHQCGVYRDLAYQLMDQQNPAQPIGAAYRLTESFTDYSGPDSTPANAFADISAGGLVSDLQYFGRTAPTCLGTDDHESFKQHFKVTVFGHDYTLTTVVSISRGRFSGTYNCNVDITTP